MRMKASNRKKQRQFFTELGSDAVIGIHQILRI
jgi:hypothetical protein